MENKYYKPSIEEFRVGFKYERRYIKDKEEIWKQEEVKSIRDLYVIPVIINNSPDELRVKYLDKEDVGELGWDLTEEDDLSLEFTLRKKGEELRILIYSIKDSTLSIEDSQGFYIFLGIIKNQSELKTLMKWLNL